MEDSDSFWGSETVTFKYSELVFLDFCRIVNSSIISPGSEVEDMANPSSRGLKMTSTYDSVEGLSGRNRRGSEMVRSSAAAGNWEFSNEDEIWGRERVTGVPGYE